MSIQVTQLTKIYGQQRAVDEASFSIREGEIVGFLGPNGAGKSTTMKVICGYMPQTSGEAYVGGMSVADHPIAVKRMTGYLPEHNPLYVDMYVHEYLRFMGGVYGLRRGFIRERVLEMVRLCGLTEEQNKRIGMLSKGFRQRVGLAQALIHDPKVLILDEPTSGLDPNQLIEIRRLIKSVSKSKTVLFSTHILQEVEALCDRVIVINKGKIVADDRLETLLQGGGTYLIVEFSNEVTVDELSTVEGVEQVRKIANFKFQLKARGREDIRSRMVQFAVEKKLSLIELRQEETSLESIFGQLTSQQQTQLPS